MIFRLCRGLHPSKALLLSCAARYEMPLRGIRNGVRFGAWYALWASGAIFRLGAKNRRERKRLIKARGEVET